jgi:Xaa-Pro aminopeptidase
MQSRIKRLALNIKDDDLAYLITTQPNIKYLTDFSTDFGIVIVTKSKAIFVTDSRYIEAVQKLKESGNAQLADTDITESGKKGYLADLLKSINIKKVLLETDITIADFARYKKTLADFEVIADFEVTKQIKDMRITKDAIEIARMKTAADVASSGFSYIISHIKEGMTEKRVATELEYFLKKEGIEKFSFDTIAVSGKNSSLPHGVPTNKELQKGDFLTLDFGVIYEGYCSDMTRTVAIGFATDEMKKVYETVKIAQERALNAVKAGKSCDEIDSLARDYITECGYGDYFRHSTGHGVGIEIHEEPAVTIGNDYILKSGNIITIEPGIYLPNKFGVRIEDMVAVTTDGFINLSSPTKELLII